MIKIKYLNNEKGVALITSIMLLSLLTIIGFSAMNSSDIELKIAGNERAATQTFNLAEAGIDHAFAQLKTDLGNGDFSSLSGQNGVYSIAGSSYHSLGNGKYEVFLKYINNDKIELTSRGFDVGNSQAKIEVNVSKNDPEFIDAPAAITCFGGPCFVNYSTGGGNPSDPNVSGYDYDPPNDFNCTGNACRQYVDSDHGYYVKPAIYQDQGGSYTQGQNVVFLGEPTPVVTNEDDPKVVEGEYTSNWPDTPDSIVFSEIGTRNDPKYSVLTASGSIDRGAGILVIDGADITLSGTGYYEGLVLIKNCGTLSTNGTPHIYGAVLIDSSATCAQGYAPFAGTGRPSVLYSSTSLSNAAGNILGWFKLHNWTQL